MAKISRYANADIQIVGSILTIQVILDPDLVDIQPSKDRNSLVIATTRGATTLPWAEPTPSGLHTTPTTISVNLTVYRPA